MFLPTQPKIVKMQKSHILIYVYKEYSKHKLMFRIWFYLTIAPFNNVLLNYLKIKDNLNNPKYLPFLRPRIANQKYQLCRSCLVEGRLCE